MTQSDFPPFLKGVVFPILICGRRETLSILQKTSRRRCAPLFSLQKDPRIGRGRMSIYSIGFPAVAEGVILSHFDLRPILKEVFPPFSLAADVGVFFKAQLVLKRPKEID